MAARLAVGVKSNGILVMKNCHVKGINPKVYHIEGSVTQRRNFIFCQNEYLISKCSEKCGLSRKHKDLTPRNTL